MIVPDRAYPIPPQTKITVSSSSVSFLVNLNIFDLRDFYYDYNFTGECYCIISAVETSILFAYYNWQKFSNNRNDYHSSHCSSCTLCRLIQLPFDSRSN